MGEALEYLVEKKIFGEHHLGILKAALDKGWVSQFVSVFPYGPKPQASVGAYSFPIEREIIEQANAIIEDAKRSHQSPNEPKIIEQLAKEGWKFRAAVRALEDLQERRFLIKKDSSPKVMYSDLIINPQFNDSIAAYFRKHSK